MNTAKMPPGLARYWKKHKRSRVRHKKASKKRAGKMPFALKRYWAARRRKGSPRRVDPSSPYFVIYARRGRGTVLTWNGAKLASHTGSAARFHSKQHAVAVGKALLRKYPILRRYQLWAARLGSTITP
jgi:hypothetical protein